MQLLAIEGHDVTLKLDPLDCLRLSQACRAAVSPLTGCEVDTAVFGLPELDANTALILAQLYQAYATALACAAVAGDDSYTMSDPEDLTAERWGRLLRSNELAVRLGERSAHEGGH